MYTSLYHFLAVVISLFFDFRLTGIFFNSNSTVYKLKARLGGQGTKLDVNMHVL